MTNEIFLSEYHKENASKNIGTRFDKNLSKAATDLAAKSDKSIVVRVHGSNRCVSSVLECESIVIGGVKSHVEKLERGAAYTVMISGEYGDILLDKL